MNETFSLIVRYHQALLDGALRSLELAAIAWTGGLLLGTPLGIWRASHNQGTKKNSFSFFSMTASSIPVMVYLLWCHYPLQSIFGISVPPFITAAMVFMFYNTLIIGEVVRAAVEDLPVFFSLAALATGVPRGVYIRHIMVPLALRAALPGYLVSQVGVLHMTLFASLISVDELFRVTQRINAIEYNAVGVFSLLALFYFVLSFPLLLLASLANKRLARLGLER
jgi:His/Glu/Gln/Arg/opine family amino acid ABC transporter permease subunit